jgi:hypothetical protein
MTSRATAGHEVLFGQGKGKSTSVSWKDCGDGRCIGVAEKQAGEYLMARAAGRVHGRRELFFGAASLASKRGWGSSEERRKSAELDQRRSSLGAAYVGRR